VSRKHPIIAVTGSSGAGTTTVMQSFQHIFRREGFKAQVVEGDSFHRYNRMEMRANMKEAEAKGNKHDSHFGPYSNLLEELESLFRGYGENGSGRVRKYIHDAGEATEHGVEPGNFTEWKDIVPGSDLMFYEGLHGGYVGPEGDVARHVDLLVGVVPIINLE
jgi:phosphoribulokinase